MTPEICHIVDNARPGVGVTQVIHDLLCDARVSARVIHIGDGAIDPRIAAHGGQHLSSPGQIVAALRVLRREGVDILHVHSRRADLAAIAGKLLGFRVIRTQHFGSLGQAAQPPGWRALRRLRNVATGRVWWIDQWVAVSETSRAYLRARWQIPDFKITTIINGVDPDKFAPADPAARTALRDRLGWRWDWVMCLSVGALVRRKRQVELVEDFAFAARRSASLHLAIVGEGSDRAALEARIAALGLGERVLLLGLRGDVPDLLRAADMFVHAAHDEAFGLVVAEAMCAGLPPVVLRGSGPGEIVIPDRTGLAVAAAERNGLGAALARLGGDSALRQRLGAQAREWGTQNLSLSAMQAAYLALYRSQG